MARPRVLLFDVFGTLVDWRGSLIDHGRALRPDLDGRWPDLVDAWRRAYQPAMNQVAVSGDAWRDLDQVQSATLDTVLAATGLLGADSERPADARSQPAGAVAEPLDADQRAAMLRGWRELHPWPDVPDGLLALRELCITATLSNGHVALLVDLLRFAGLRVDAPLSAQLALSYKPQPIVYLHAIDLLDVAIDEAMLVACHASDLRAAAALGMRTAFVLRPREWGDAGGDEPPKEIPGLIVADGLVDLAAQLKEMGPPGA